MLSFLYLGLRRVFEVLAPLGRSGDRKELEILVLRHELGVLRRQAKPARYRTTDRALLAALSRVGGTSQRIRRSGAKSPRSEPKKGPMGEAGLEPA